MKRALITGITGQDGSYLAEFLLSKGYEVHGIVRRASSFGRGRIEHLCRDAEIKDRTFFLHYGDMTDSSRLEKIVEESKPDEVYNLAAQSHVRVSFDMPEFTFDVNATGTIRLLDALRNAGLVNRVRFYQASTSELYGLACETPQSEMTPFHPRSPYAIAKMAAFWSVKNQREAYGMFASNGIMFNHESPRRGENFVTRKISMSVARIKYGLQNELVLGNLDAKRDWGYAGDYIEGMWRILQHSQPDDFVLATGETHSVREFLQSAFAHVGLDWEKYVRCDGRYERPSEVDVLVGNADKAKRELGWRSTVSFKELVSMMVDADMELARRESMVLKA